jgi:hypothetical protein
MTNNAKYTLNVKFYSTSHVWPSDNQMYVLNTRSPVPFRLNCEAGERVCYRAAYKYGQNYWGVGLEGDRGCQNCCLTCAGDKEVVYNFNLTDN